MTEEQIRQIIRLSEGEKYSYDANCTWVDLFLKVVDQNPQKRAVEDEEGSYTYKELDEASDRIAGYLVKEGLKENDFVAVRMKRSKEFPAVVLGIHKAGGAYVPIDLDYPRERTAYMLADSDSQMLMSDRLIAAALAEGKALSRNEYRYNPENLAYMIYTSGSTGKPKGVMIQHKAMLNLVHFIRKRWGLGPDSRICCHSNFAFDASVEDLYPVLTVGGTLFIVPEEIRKDIFEMRDYVASHGITGGNYSTGFGQLLAADVPMDVEYMCIGGEAMTSVPKVTGAMYNTYGPTEFTVDATYFEVDKDREYHTIPIGRPLYNCAAFIMGKEHELLPPGETGELCLSGPQLALGYWKKPELTAEKFVEVQIAGGDIRKVYCTGDLARYNEEGQLEFCGRIDSQVKLRGFRIELGEIESTALKYEGIRQAAAEVRRDTLCLYYTSSGDIDEEDLKKHLGKTLTDYMIPGWFRRLDRMPETPNGKLDRKALPEPVLMRSAGSIPPRNEAERIVSSCMKKALGIDEELGLSDDFLNLGGDSIKAIRLLSFLRENNLVIKTTDLMKYRTVEAIAANCSESHQAVATDEPPIEGFIEDSAIFLYYRHLEFPNPSYFNQSTLLECRERADISALQRSFDALCCQHDMLRACIRAGHLYVRRADEPKPAVTIEEYSLERDEKSVIEDKCESIQSALSVSEGLVRAAVFHLPERELLFITAHHTIVDGISWRILLDDLESAYGQAMKGRDIKLPKKTETYRDYAQVMKAYRDSYELSLEIPYWKKVERKLLSMDTSLNRDFSRHFRKLSVYMDEAGTEGLIYANLSVYGLTINDLLLAAVAESYRKIFHRSAVSVQMEGHGREPLGRELLTGRTIGWFTSIYPVVIEDINGEAEHDLIRVKETLHRVPNKGAGYIILACLEGNKPVLFVKDRIAKIMFNYLGDVSGEGREKRFFAPDSKDGFDAGLDYQAKENCDGSDLIINCLIDRGRFGLWLDYNCDEFDSDTAAGFADGILEAAGTLTEHLAGVSKPKLTASDLGEHVWSDEEFDGVVSAFGERGEKIKRIYPLTPLQEGMLLYHVSDPAAHAYRLVDIYALDFLPAESELRRALDALGKKHETLRTAIIHKGVSVPRQAVIADRRLGLTMLDISEEEDKLSEACRIREGLLSDGFDLQDKPLFQLVCAKTGESSCYIITAVHHIMMDGWSVDIYMKDLEDYLIKAREGDGDIEVEGADEGRFEAAVSELLKKDRDAAVNCFTELLDRYEGVTRIPDHTPVDEAEQSDVNVICMQVSAGDTAAFEHVCREEMVTLADGIEAAWGLTLSTACRMDDVVFNRVVSGRDKYSFDVSEQVGLFINTVPARLRINDDSTAVSLAMEIHRQSLDTGEYDFCPLSEIKKVMNATEGFGNTLISIENYMGSNASGAILKPVLVKEEPIDGIAVDVESQADGSLIVRMTFDPGQYRKQEIERLKKLFGRYIAMFTHYPRKPVGKLPLLDEEDLKEILGLSLGEKLDYDASLTYADLFRKQAAATPDGCAVMDADSAMTYSGLDEASDRIAAFLLAKGIRKNDFVAVRMGRIKEFMAVTIGIHKAGAAYVPIDPDCPDDRAEYMIEDSGAAIVFTDDMVKGILSGDGKADKVISRATPETAAYMIYTSGSTGKPKGVVVSHRALLNFSHCIVKQYGLTCRSRISCHPNFSFDASVENLYPVLTVGGTTVIVPEEARRDIGILKKFIAEKHITGGGSSTRLVQLLGAEETLELDYITLGGEAMTTVPNVTGRVFNAYGPTEFTVISTIFELQRGREYHTIPIGRPLYNCAAYIVDKKGRLLPRGMTGELCMAGPQMALGYHNRPELTKEKFSDIHIDEKDRVRVYHTGDLARYNEEGQLEYCGRIDFQIKLRGFRIEPGEIENCAARYPGIVHAAALVKKNTLCLFYSSDQTIDEAGLRTFMGQSLTGYMIPGCFMRLEEMPMTASGKIDRKKLPDPDFSARKAVYEAPTNDVERRLCEACERVLNLEKNSVGINDDFFEIGGDSIKAMMMINAAGIGSLSAKLIFRCRTAKKIAEAISESYSEDLSDYEEKARRMSIPAHKGQVQMIDDQFYDLHSCMFNLASLYRLGADTDPWKLAAAVDAAAADHPALCSTFGFDEDGKVIISVVPGFPGKTGVLKVASGEVRRTAESLKQPFIMFREPLFRAKVLTCDEETYLFIDMHHAVSDGVSIGVLLSDIARAYRGEELSEDHFYSYLLKEYEARESEEFNRAFHYFNDLLGSREWCCYPSLDFETIKSDSAIAEYDSVITTEQMKKAEERTGYSRNVMAITATMLAMQEYCRRDDISVDYLSNNRTEKYLQGSVGLIFKTLPIAVCLNDHNDIQGILREVNRQVIECFANSICDYRAEVNESDLDSIAVNYVADLGKSGDMTGFNAEEIPLAADETMGGHADIYFIERDNRINIEIEYLKHGYKKESMVNFTGLCAKYLRQIARSAEKRK